MRSNGDEYSGRIDFRAADLPNDGLCFSRFDSVVRADRLEDVVPALREVEAACLRGSYAVGFVAYEAAAAFDSALRTHPASDLPLLFFGLSTQPSPCAVDDADDSGFSTFEPSWSEADYLERFTVVQERIRNGDTYQINLAFPLDATFHGSPATCYHQLRSAQNSAYCGMIQGPDFSILSVSPELFFERRGNRIETRPMKGTRKRGRTTVEDTEIAAQMRSSEKDRAENVMIVDLLRNDLGRIAITGSVEVPNLFTVEKYPTVWQMTSTVRGELVPTTGLTDVFNAIFPCGSVTGAPKVKTMEIIKGLEVGPRGVYCGAFGVVLPGGDCIFNVPIRTMTVVGDRARYSVGSGLVADSDGSDEYEECLIKARVLDRGSHRFQLLETLLWEVDDGFLLLDRHLCRLSASATLFGFRVVAESVKERLRSCVDGATCAQRIRLLVDLHGHVEVQATPIQPDDVAKRVIKLAETPIDSTYRYLYHKTTRREVYDRERERLDGCFDAILYNERGEITESTIANVAVELDGQWVTPPVDCGLLPGVMRAELLARGELTERIVTIDDLKGATGIRLLNSVRRLFNVTLRKPT